MSKSGHRTTKRGFDISLKLLVGLVFFPFLLMYWIFKIVKYVLDR